MTTFSLTAHVLASLCIVASAVLMWMPSRARLALRFEVGGFVLLTASLITRWVVTGHPAIFGTFENVAAAVWFILAFAILDEIGPFAGMLPGRVRVALVSWTPPLLAFGAFFEAQPFPLTISERNLLVDIHALFAWASHTLLLGVGSAAVLQLVDSYRAAARVCDGGSDGDEGADEKSVHIGDEYHDFIFKGAGVGLAVFTLMIAVGAFYNYALFAQWFTWEIVEVFAISAWIAYSSVVHSVMFFGWRGRRLSWAVIASTLLMLGTFWVWSFYAGTYHHFEIPSLRAR